MTVAQLNPRAAVRTHPATYALSLFGGVMVALGIPPLGWWPLIVAGVACYVVAAERADRRVRTQFWIAALFAWGWLAPGMGWMWQLVPGGFVIAPTLFASMHGAAAVASVRLVPKRDDTNLTIRIISRLALHGLVEGARVIIPFGGVPLAGMALGIADTRLADLARLVGPLGLSFWMMLIGGIGAESWLRRRDFGWRSRRGTLVVLGLLIIAQVAAQVAPNGRDTGRTIRIAAVQGGGPQGVLAINSNSRDVIDRHLAATRLLDAEDQLDLIVWPENAIDVGDFTTSTVRDQIVAEVRRIGAPFAVGITEDAGENFTNAQIVVDENGNELSRYDKVRRVPYGEYIPLRALLDALGAPVDRIPRDAIPGASPAVIDVPVGTSDSVTLAVAISWEVFFSGRVDDGVAAGGEVVLNPTNGSSYTGEILQRQQVATSQLRALESGRYVVQAATTGYSLVVDANGTILQRIPIGQSAVIIHDVPLRTGRTIYSHLGDWTMYALLLGVVGVVGWRTRRRAG